MKSDIEAAKALKNHRDIGKKRTYHGNLEDLNELKKLIIENYKEIFAEKAVFNVFYSCINSLKKVLRVSTKEEYHYFGLGTVSEEFLNTVINLIISETKLKYKDFIDSYLFDEGNKKIIPMTNERIAFLEEKRAASKALEIANNKDIEK